jgi:hypothetical protein
VTDARREVFAGLAGPGRRREAPPLPLLVGFAVFLLVMGYLVASSFTRRSAPTFAPTAEGRVRAPGWERAGDTITVDATDGNDWRYVSLTVGRVLTVPDTAGWEIAVRRYNLVPRWPAADLGAADFDAPGRGREGPWAGAQLGAAPADTGGAIGRWYRYSLLTHLLESKRHVYVVRAARGDRFKLQVLSYYCPGLTAGCVTLRYAPTGRRSSAE